MSPRASVKKLGTGPKVSVKTVESFSRTLDEDALKALVLATLPESLQKDPLLKIQFYGDGDFTPGSCEISWERTSHSEKVLS